MPQPVEQGHSAISVPLNGDGDPAGAILACRPSTFPGPWAGLDTAGRGWAGPRGHRRKGLNKEEQEWLLPDDESGAEAE